MLATPRDYFEKNRYVYLTNVLSKEHCANLTKHMFDLFNNGKLEKDPQCPLSDSVYGNPVLDQVLASLVEPLSKQLGVQLLPTYTYARIYRPGEILKRHTDRESCEISATLTLGYDEESELWPIHFTLDAQDVVGQMVQIDIGDAVIYRGNELTHWRQAYRGRWQTQVFFHFVDANGPHKEFAFDKRQSLGISAETKKVVQQQPESKLDVRLPVYNGVMIPAWDMTCPGAASYSSQFRPELTLTKEECRKIVEFAKHRYPAKSKVGSDANGKYNPSIRRVDQYGIQLNDQNKWIFDRVAQAISIANEEYYRYDLMGIIHELQLLHYKADEKGFYDWHADVGPGEAATRKLSMSIMLTDPSEYEGGNLMINDYGNIINTTKEQGSISMFPSFALHTVTPVTKGERWVLVIWVHGSQRFK